MVAFVGSMAAAIRPSFAGAALTAPRTAPRTTTTMVASKSVPFLEAPPKLTGSAVGDVGFDPLYLSDYLNLEYTSAAEIKNGRVAMLACLGMLVQEFVHLPAPAFAESNPIKAIYAVPVEGWAQIILVICLVELATFKSTYTSGADLGFDPLGMGKGDTTKLRLNELKNGRLAMLGVAGMIMTSITTGKGPIAAMTSF